MGNKAIVGCGEARTAPPTDGCHVQGKRCGSFVTAPYGLEGADHGE
ncbi:hypothetical protein SAMN05421881_11163 [Nitrosomonas halophila]|uniref:Uncharacterized protein n=1 Tax=Nitrosomonas halophila TaxID=44576 RepID=A0A1H3PVT9_9PROT|nr:hypothetical protein SAMN05421881_11163 [Nitrosomonas halophila]